MQASAYSARDVAIAAKEHWRITGEHAEVLTESDELAESFGLDGSSAVLAAVMVPSKMHAEFVIDIMSEVLVDISIDLSALSSAGWTLNVLAPLESLGRAHEVLRGIKIHLQGWTVSPDRRVKFMPHEVP